LRLKFASVPAGRKTGLSDTEDSRKPAEHVALQGIERMNATDQHASARTTTRFLSFRRVVSMIVFTFITFVAVKCVLPSVLPGTTPVNVENLIRQFEGKAYYWNHLREEPGLVERLLQRLEGPTAQFTAAEMLGDMGPAAVESVPVLLDEFVHGSNDIDTGDGVLPIRSSVAIALGKIGDKQAIEPLMEKLKVQEKSAFGPGYSGGTVSSQPLGVGHHAIVKALGMFGSDAKPALPLIRSLQETADERLREKIANAINNIEGR